MYPCSPNWFASRLLSVSADGDLVAFCSKNHITVFSADSRSFSDTLLKGSYDRLNGVCFLVSSQYKETLLVAGGVDGIVRLWDPLSGRQLEKVHSHKNPITVVAASRFREDLVVSGDSTGKLVFWFVGGVKFDVPLPEVRSAVVCLDIHPTLPVCVAGFQSGALVVVEYTTDDAKIVARYAQCTSPIQCVCWERNSFDLPEMESWAETLKRRKGRKKKAKANIEDSEVNFDELIKQAGLASSIGLFAATDKQGTLRLFEYEGGRQESCVMRGMSSLSRRSSGSTEPARRNGWFTTLWISPHVLAASNDVGDVILFHVDHNLAELKQIRMIQRPNTRSIFSMVYSKRTGEIFTCSMDRRIVCIGVSDWSVKYALHSIGGTIHSLSSAKSGEGVVLIAAGDGNVRIWDTNAPITKPGRIFWKGIQNARVTTVSLNPLDSDQILFGCEDGKFGLIDAITGKVSHLVSFKNFGRIKHAEWSEADDSSIYSLNSAGKIHLHTDVFGKDKTSEVDISSSDMDDTAVITSFTQCYVDDDVVLAIGYGNGCVLLAKGESTSSPLLLHSKEVTALSFSCAKGHKLASASIDTTICIYSLEAAGENTPELLSNAVLRGHKSEVSGLAWSPSGTNICTSSMDGLVLIWSPETNPNLPIGSYGGHYGKVTCVSWNNDGKIVSGGQDNTVRCWDPDAYMGSASVALKDIKESRVVGASIAEKEAGIGDVVVFTSKRKRRKREKKATVTEESNSNFSFREERMLSFLRRADWRTEISNEIKEGTGVSAEVKYLCGLGKEFLEDSLKGVTKRIAIPAELVVAPSFGVNVWKTLMEREAKKALGEGRHFDSALIYSALGDIHNSVRALTEGQRFVDAFLVSITRLPPFDTNLGVVVNGWIIALLEAKTISSTELASELYLKVLNDPKMALDVLVDFDEPHLVDYALKIVRGMTDGLVSGSAGIVNVDSAKISLLKRKSCLSNLLRSCKCEFLSEGHLDIFFMEAFQESLLACMKLPYERFLDDDGERVQNLLTRTSNGVPHDASTNSSILYAQFLEGLLGATYERGEEIWGVTQKAHLIQSLKELNGTAEIVQNELCLYDLAVVFLEGQLSIEIGESMRRVALWCSKATDINTMRCCLMCLPCINSAHLASFLETGEFNALEVDSLSSQYVSACAIFLLYLAFQHTDTIAVGIKDVISVVRNCCLGFLSLEKVQEADALRSTTTAGLPGFSDRAIATSIAIRSIEVLKVYQNQHEQSLVTQTVDEIINTALKVCTFTSPTKAEFAQLKLENQQSFNQVD